MSPYGFLFGFEIHPAVSLLSKARGHELRQFLGSVPCLAARAGSTHSTWLSMARVT